MVEPQSALVRRKRIARSAKGQQQGQRAEHERHADGDCQKGIYAVVRVVGVNFRLCDGLGGIGVGSPTGHVDQLSPGVTRALTGPRGKEWGRRAHEQRPVDR